MGKINKSGVDKEFQDQARSPADGDLGAAPPKAGCHLAGENPARVALGVAGWFRSDALKRLQATGLDCVHELVVVLLVLVGVAQ